MQRIGHIVRLQVQQSSLKVGESPRRYDPSPLLRVDRLHIAPAGVSATGGQGDPIVDVHNQEHPASKNRRGVNGVSLGFTTHYDAMRERFGPHLADGIAGENILIAVDRVFDEEALAGGVIIGSESGPQVRLAQVIVAAPCVEFSRYALRFPDDQRPDASVTQALQFLHNGMRGFYAAYEGEPASLSAGDEVFIP